MVCYTYDGSFEGLLTAIYEAYYRKEKPVKILQEENLQPSMLYTYIHIATDIEKSQKVYNSIMEKISEDALDNIYHVFLADREYERGTIIYNYLRLGWKIGRNIDLHLSDDRVMKVLKIRQRVEREVHRMMGFVRFSLVGGNIYYAPIEPDNNILPLIAPHFAERLSDQKWIIHDKARELAALYNTRDWLIVEADLGKIPIIDAGEKHYRDLWKEFYNSVAIKERYNLSLHKKLLPVRYWRNLTEKN
ncbi:MAG TPA: DNA metabolism protein [Clostridiaceae bacterium]|nr:DNA metabolism protein [Clostridiaceae bacterium]